MISNNTTDCVPQKGERVEKASEYIQACDKLLDVGCGNGVIAHFVKEKVKKIYGIDSSKIALKKAKQNGLATTLVNFDKEKFPFESNFFDIITCLDVIEHVKNPQTLIHEIYRVLKKNGILILSTPNIRFSDHLATLIIKGRFPHTSMDNSILDEGHIHFFTFKDITNLLKSEKFKIIKEDGIINKRKRGWKGQFLQKIAGEKLMREFRSGGILVVARK